jgi:putative oxidoreductase
MKALRHAPAAARILLGLVFTIFGANFFLHFIPQPPMEPGPAVDLAMALMGSYVMTTVKVVEVVAGLALLSDRFVPLALAVLAPIVVGINGFHLTLAPATGGAGYLVLALELYLAWAYRDAFKPMLQARAEPSRLELHEQLPRSVQAS